MLKSRIGRVYRTLRITAYINNEPVVEDEEQAKKLYGNTQFSERGHAKRLMDFFRPSIHWGSPNGNESLPGGVWKPDYLENLTVVQVHELWYVLLRERNRLNTEKYHAWKQGVNYQHAYDAEYVIAQSMHNIKMRLERHNQRANIIQDNKDPRMDRCIRLTSPYDTSNNGTEVKLDKHKTPATIYPPDHYPANPNTHFISRYEPQQIEQPVEISYNEELDRDKLQLKEDREMQEHYHWEKVQNLWDFYVSQQVELLDAKELDRRETQGFYPKEMPDWWRVRYGHENMWKYGIWPQHSVLAHRKHLRKYQNEDIEFTEDDYYKEQQPKD